MRWLEIHIDTNAAGLEEVQALLSAQDIDGIQIEDETDFQDFLENNRDYWDYVDEDLAQHMAGRSRVTFYLEANEAGFAKMGEVRIALAGLKEQRSDCGPLIMSLEDIQDADWENNWKQYYKPMEIGQRLLVIPQWEQTDPGERVPLYLDPGLTFGTGAHASTRLCLEFLEEIVRAANGCWTWAAAAEFYRLPHCAWGLLPRWRWILMTSAKMPPREMLPSTALRRKPAASGLGISLPTAYWQRKSAEVTILCLRTLWQM